LSFRTGATRGRKEALIEEMSFQFVEKAYFKLKNNSRYKFAIFDNRALVQFSPKKHGDKFWECENF